MPTADKRTQSQISTHVQAWLDGFNTQESQNSSDRVKKKGWLLSWHFSVAADELKSYEGCIQCVSGVDSATPCVRAGSAHEHGGAHPAPIRAPSSTYEPPSSGVILHRPRQHIIAKTKLMKPPPANILINSEKTAQKMKHPTRYCQNHAKSIELTTTFTKPAHTHKWCTFSQPPVAGYRVDTKGAKRGSTWRRERIAQRSRDDPDLLVWNLPKGLAQNPRRVLLHCARVAFEIPVLRLRAVKEILPAKYRG
eukprot:1188374-Prorocentrum_minimum.AAC.6